MASTIRAGDRIPSVAVKLIDAAGVADTTSDDVLGTGRVVFFTVPGAFTPTCHTNHLPGFIANAPKLRAAGVAVNLPTACVVASPARVMAVDGFAGSLLETATAPL